MNATVLPHPSDASTDALRAVETAAQRGGALVFWSQAVRALVEGCGTLLLARLVSPAAFGLVDMVIAVTGFIDLFKDFGLSAATIQRARLAPQEVNALFWINAALGAALTLISAALAPLIALGYARPQLLELGLALSLSSLLGALGVQHQAMLRRALRFRALALIEVWSAALSTGVALLAAAHGWGAWSLVLRQLSRLALTTLLSWLWSDFRVERPRKVDVRSLLTFGSHVSGFQLMNYLERNLDNVLIGRFAGAEPLAFYTRAYEIMRLPLQHVTGPAALVALPALSRLAEAPDRYRRAYVHVVRVLMLITIPLAPVAILCADVLVPWILGPHWQGSVELFRYLGLTLLLKPLANTSSWLFLSQGRSRELWRWSLVGTPLAALSFLVGLPWGALGVAISYAAMDLIVRMPILFWLLGRRGPIGVGDLFACLWPAWVTAAGAASAFVALSAILARWPDPVRVLVAAPVALGAGLVLLACHPAGRAVLRDALQMARGLRLDVSREER